GALGGLNLEARSNTANVCKPQESQDTNVEPANVKLPPFRREAARCAMGVMIVVQLFAANDDANRKHVGAGVRAGIVPVADKVAQAVDNARCPEGNPGHLDGPYRQTENTEQSQVDAEHDQDTHRTVA